MVTFTMLFLQDVVCVLFCLGGAIGMGKDLFIEMLSIE
jgi:hypothetical protein